MHITFDSHLFWLIYVGLYKGWVVTSSRAAILTSAQLGSYDTIKNNVLIKSVGMHEGFMLHLIASMASGLITTTAANPGIFSRYRRKLTHYTRLYIPPYRRTVMLVYFNLFYPLHSDI
jgi:hypothetical protein